MFFPDIGSSLWVTYFTNKPGLPNFVIFRDLPISSKCPNKKVAIMWATIKCSVISKLPFPQYKKYTGRGR